MLPMYFSTYILLSCHTYLQTLFFKFPNGLPHHAAVSLYVSTYYVIQTRHVRSPFKSSSYPDWSRMHISDVLLSNAERLTRGLHLLLLRTKLHFCLHLVRWPYMVPKSTLLLSINKQPVFRPLKVCTVSLKPDAHAIFNMIENSVRFLKITKKCDFFYNCKHLH